MRRFVLVVLAACGGGGGAPDGGLDAVGDPIAEASGVYVLSQTVTSASPACADVAPDETLSFHVDADGDVGFGVDVGVVDVVAAPAIFVATVELTARDTWGDLRPTIEYDLTVEADGGTAGTAVAVDGDCTIEVTVAGTNQCPGAGSDAGVYDDGWNVWCAAGTVYTDDLTRYGYAHLAGADPECYLGGAGHETITTTCANGCADTEVHWFETFDEWSAFDEQTLCNP